MIEFLIIPLMAFAFRLRGNGWPNSWKTGKPSTTNGRLLWSSVCGLIFLGLFGVTEALCAIMGAYLGMMLSHSKWYQFKRKGSVLCMTLICGARWLFLSASLGASAFILLPIAAIAGMMAYFIGARAQVKGWTNDQLSVSEPLFGAVIGVLVVVAHGAL